MRERAGLTVVSWNAQGSQGMNVPAVADALARFDADVVLLQEIQRRQLGALRRAGSWVDARWRFKHWPVRIPAEGLGVLSRLALVDVHVQMLARALQFWSWRRRIALHVGVPRDGTMLRFVDVHLGAGVTPEERTRQARAVLAHSPDAAVVGGDLNAAPGSLELETFARAGHRDAERRRWADRPAPATNWAPGPRTGPPTQRLDYLLVTDDVVVLDAEVPDDWRTWAAWSDHLPVVARLGL